MPRRSSRRRRPSSPSPVRAPPLEDDDLLEEILLRLPAQPPHLLWASLVSKRWRGLATDPQFLSRFRIHHRKPPLLGLLLEFSNQSTKVSFRSTLDSPYNIPPTRFSLRADGLNAWRLVDSRHGRVLFEHLERREAIVWDPITEDHCFVAIPPRFHNPKIANLHVLHWAMLCAAGEQGHVHSWCHWSPFQIVLVPTYRSENQAVAIASVYSSETGTWGDLLTTAVPCVCFPSLPSTLVGNTLHWLSIWSSKAIQFDLDSQRLAVVEIERPPGAHYGVQTIHSEDGGVAFATLSNLRDEPCFQMWERKVNSYGVPTWVLLKSVELQKSLGLGLQISKENSSIVRYAEDAHTIFLLVYSSIYMVKLESMQFKKLPFKGDPSCTYHPFSSFSSEGLSRPA